MHTTIAKRTIPFHRAFTGEDEVRAITEVVRSGWLTMGAKTVEFEKQFASYVNAKYAIAVSSCTAALHLSLDAIGVGHSDEVLVPTTTFTSTAEVVTYLGARPVLVDVEGGTLNIDVQDADRKVTPRTRAIVPVHFAGQPCNLGDVEQFSNRCGLHVIEDAAHALPAEYEGRRIGSISELTAFSFYATKTLCTGEGGMITTNNEQYAARAQIMRLHGINRDAWKRYTSEGTWFYEVIEAGYKYNFTDLQAALGMAQLAKCDLMQKARCSIAQRYTEAFQRNPALLVPGVSPGRTSAWHLYVLRLRPDRLRINRDVFIQELAAAGVTCSVHFIPLHLHPFYQRKYGYKSGDFPVAEAEYARTLSLPIYPGMTAEEVDYVIWAVMNTAERFAR